MCLMVSQCALDDRVRYLGDLALCNLMFSCLTEVCLFLGHDKRENLAQIRVVVDIGKLM